MKNFTYNIPTKVFFGEGMLQKVGAEIGKYSKRVLIAYGSERIKKNGLFSQIAEQFEQNGIFYAEISSIKPNPELSSVHEGIRMIKENNLDFVLAVGGGSVIDAAKAMAAGAASDVDPWLFCSRKTRVTAALPLATVLTLSATGSEMNGNSVISNSETGEKLPFSSEFTKPVFSILDPTLTYSVPKDQTAAGVVDIFAHVAEQYFEPVNSAGVADRMAEAIFKTAIQYGRKAIDEPNNYEARANLMWAGSLALNSLLSYGKSRGDWATHGIEHEISAVYDITHGLGLAIVLPNWMRYVLSDETVDRFAMFAENVWGIIKDDKFEQAKAGIDATEAFFRSLEIQTRLSEINIDSSRFDHMAKQATQFGDIGAFKTLNTNDVKNILEMCL